MSQFGIRAKLCAGKIGIGSSIQAQRHGDFMRRKWRSYGLSDNCVNVSFMLYKNRKLFSHEKLSKQ
jgi:hypothetical protein